MLSNFYFIHALWLLGIIAVVIWFLTTRHKTLISPSIIRPINVFYPLSMALNQHQVKHKTKNIRLWLSIIFSLLFISLAQLAFKTPLINTTKTQQDVDLILVVNTSVSMVLRDYKEQNASGEFVQFDRMTKTKEILKQLVLQFKGKRIAFVVLGRPAAVWLPLTGDINQVLHSIDKLQTTLGGRTNDIGATLQLVSQQFNQPSAQQKMVLLINDGYLQIGSVSPLQSIKQLIKQKFIVHSLAIGSPKRPEFSLGVGHLIYAPVDLKLMRSLAEAGQGKVVHAWQNNAVNELLKIIDKPTKTPVASITQFKNTPLYFYPLSLAMAMILILVFPINRLSATKHS